MSNNALPDVYFLCPDLPPDAEAEFKKLIPSPLEIAAEDMLKLALAISFTAADYIEDAMQFHDFCYDLVMKFPKLNLDVCAGCGNRCLCDFESAKDHPCPLYNRTLLCKFRHFIGRTF